MWSWWGQHGENEADEEARESWAEDAVGTETPWTTLSPRTPVSRRPVEAYEYALRDEDDLPPRSLLVVALLGLVTWLCIGAVIWRVLA